MCLGIYEYVRTAQILLCIQNHFSLDLRTMTNVIVVADEVNRPFWGSPLYEIIISFITLGILSVTAYYALYTKRLWTETKTAIEAAC